MKKEYRKEEKKILDSIKKEYSTTKRENKLL
jgi:hypothetical protein